MKPGPKPSPRPPCSVADCAKPANCKGYCNSHYMRAHRYGDPLAGQPQRHAANEWSDTPAYHCWINIRERCERANNPAYRNYGGRGIAVCERWQTFGNFLEDMGQPPLGMTIERRDNDGDYEPGNCRWATRAEQNRNKRNNRHITIGDETLTVAEWAARCGLDQRTIHYRLKAGWPDEVAVKTPRITRRKGIPRGHRLFPKPETGVQG